jgi:prepilin-type N-terminal cleavage/methylation domain-containing protein
MRKNQRGFTLVELAVVVVIIGVLAAFAVPRFMASVERSKAAEAFNFLSAVQAAQERYHARQGTYATLLTDLDIKMSTPKYFTPGSISAGTTGNLQNSWKLTLTRTGASAGYGEYTVTYNEEGFDLENSTIAQKDDINPMQTGGTTTSGSSGTGA